jgi:hypothetical protein
MNLTAKPENDDELSRRLQLKQLNITANTFNPGLMLDTKLARDYTEAELCALLVAISPSILQNARTSQTMGSALAWLIVDPAIEGVTGKYFDGLDEIPSSSESYSLPLEDSRLGRYGAGSRGQGRRIDIGSLTPGREYDEQKATELWESSLQLVKLIQ